MKHSDITSKIIERAKEIAKYWRMEIYEGCWISNGTEVILVKNIIEGLSDVWFPIPSISDILWKLRERDEWMPDYYNKKDFNRSLLNIFKNYIEGKFMIEEVHYWLLSALLEVLRNSVA